MATQDTVIRVEHVSKRYLIGHETRGQRGSETFRDVISQSVRSFGRTAREMMRGGQIIQGDEVEEFWALKDVSFELKRGEVIGIIGRNGAGKSTLLKVLSRITEPTEGRVTIKGRVASLLEVGTGFHPELTGRENVYLNGAILGMARAEIKSKFDEIVAFADVEKFLDTPVKRYSSGMYVRLAFAVAAHLEPEILIVDEVLSVGDAEFQKKCLGKMSEVAGQGRTVLFVSHNLDAVERLCSRAAVLQVGHIVYDGDATSACQVYLGSVKTWALEDRLEDRPHQGSGEIKFINVELFNSAMQPAAEIPAGEDFTVRIHYLVNTPVRRPFFGFALLSAQGVRVFNTALTDASPDIEVVDEAGFVEVHIRDLTLAIGHYFCTIAVADKLGNYYDYVKEIPLFDSVMSDKLPQFRVYDQSSGMIFAQARWVSHVHSRGANNRGQTEHNPTVASGIENQT